MNKVIDFFIRQPIWANALIFLTIIFGAFSLFNMSSSFFPELEPTRITISVFYPGASPEEMEEGITVKIEESLKGIAGIEETYSTSSENTASVVIKTYQDEDLDEVTTEVKNAIDGISSFPDGAERPIVVAQKTNGMAANVAFVSISGDVDRFKLKAAAEAVEDDLLNSGKISQVKIIGYPVTEFSIEVREDELLRYNLTFDEVANAIRTNNRDISAGMIKTATEELIIRSKAKTIESDELENIILRALPDGQYLKIGDVADINYQFSDSPMESYLNGKRNVVFYVTKLPSEDLGAISDFIKDYVADYNKKNKDLNMSIMFDFNDMLNDRIELLMRNGLMGLLLVLITLGLFLSLRLSFWVAFGIPFSFLGMFIIGSFYGMTINMISLFGMILVVGILVDDGIVIAENIYSHYERGKPPHLAALEGTVEVLPAVFTSILTTVIAFSVLFFIQEMEMIAQMAFVVIASLLFSLIEAFLILPSHLSSKSILKTKKGRAASFRAKIDKGVAYMREEIYGYMLRWVVSNPRKSFFAPLIFIVIVIVLLSQNVIKTTFFPAIPFDDFKVEVAFKPGEREDKTKAFLDFAHEKVQEVNRELIEETGDTLITYTTVQVGSTESLGETGANTGMIRVSLDVEGKSVSSFEIVRRVRDKIGEVKDAEKFIVGGEHRWGKPVSISLRGKDFREIKEANSYLKSELNKMPELKDVTDNAGLGKREILIKLKPQAYMLGLNHGEISRQIRQGFFGDEVQRLIVGTEEVRVWVRYPEADRSSLSGLEKMRVRTPSGQLFPIEQLVDYDIDRGEVNIRHFDGAREIRIDADQADAFASTTDILGSVKANIIPKLKSLYPGITVEYMGQQRRAQKSTASMQYLMLIAIFLMLLVISLNFNSFYQAFLIIMVIPAGIFGAILGHGIEGMPVSTLSAWGMIALMGILVNDAVVYLDTFNRNLKKGQNIQKAVYNAGIARFRPIILTSITTIAGLYPLILETSFQAQFLIPMGVSVAYGVLFGTFFILVFLPALILTMNDLKRIFKWTWTGSKPSKEEVEPTLVHVKRLAEIDRV
ncbi:MAG: efflux RND transporter permease subunit [Vicingaceae bacterium]